MAGKKKNPETGLSDKEEAFCREYLVDANQTQAAIRAGYSERSANVHAVELMKRPAVQARIAELMAERAERTQISADRVIKELADIGFAAMEASEIVRQMRELVSNGVDPRALARISYQDKLRALELLGKHLKLFTDKHEHSGPDGGPIQHRNLSDEQLDAEIARRIGHGSKEEG